MGKLTNLNPPAPLTDAQIPSSITRDDEVTTAFSAHTAAPDPHPQYATQQRADDRYGNVKKIPLSGITASSQGTSALIPHGGLLVDKISAINGVVEHSPGLLVPPGHTASPGYEFDLSSNATHIFVTNVTNKSANILAKKVRIVIDYLI